MPTHRSSIILSYDITQFIILWIKCLKLNADCNSVIAWFTGQNNYILVAAQTN